MNFKEAIMSGEKVKSEYWSDGDFIDANIFSKRLDDMTKNLFYTTAKPLSWKEMLGEWIVLEGN